MKRIAAILAGVAIIGTACGSSTDKTKVALLSQTPQATSASGDTGRASPTTAPEKTATATTAATATSPTRTPTATSTPTIQPLQIVAKGYGKGEFSGSYAFIVENPNADTAFEGITFQIAAYDAAGTVLNAETALVAVLLPKQRLGVASSLSLPAGTKLDRLDIQFKPTKTSKSEVLPTFTTENVTYRGDRFATKVTGVVVSPYGKDFTEVRTNAIAYDGEGNIIGGGFTYLDFVPANGRSAVEVSVFLSGQPAKVELYAALSGLSQ